MYHSHVCHVRVVFVHNSKSCKASGEGLAYGCISAGCCFGCHPSSNFGGVNVWDVVGDFVEGTIRFWIKESIAESVCDAIKEELCVVIVCESPVPSLRPRYNGEGAGC